jgi:hypothetical protein
VRQRSDSSVCAFQCLVGKLHTHHERRRYQVHDKLSFIRHRTMFVYCLFGVQSACQALDDKKVNVHLVPHSHDDVGWLQTFAGYYYGTGGKLKFISYIFWSRIAEQKCSTDLKN